MICLQLFLLLLAVAVVRSADYLIFATEGTDKKTTFHRSDLNLEITKELGTTELPSALDKLFISNHPNHRVLYWSYKSFDNIGCSQFGKKNLETKCLKKEQKGTFIGFDSSNYLNFYFPESKTIDVINLDTEKKVKTLNGLTKIKTELRFLSRNPNNKDEAYFQTTIEPTTQNAVAFNLKQDKIVETYDIEPAYACNHALILTLNGENSYCAEDRVIYITSRVEQSFNEIIHYQTKYKIVHFAVGNDEVFYSTSETEKIFRLTENHVDAQHWPVQTVHKVRGTVTALFAYKSDMPETSRA